MKDIKNRTNSKMFGALRKEITLLCGVLIPTFSYGETGIHSPYTRYGIGNMAETNSVAAKAMGGVGYAMQSKIYNNPLNPASYVVIDSLTFSFDAGAGASFSTYKETGKSEHYTNGNLHHITMRFPVSRNVAVSAGLIPYSTVGYNYAVHQSDVRGDVSYSGSGGLSQLYAGVAYSPIRGLSVGANFTYLFGSITNTKSLIFSDTTTIEGYAMRESTLKSFKMDIGLQYTIPFNSSHLLTLGVVFSPGTRMSSEIANIEKTEAASIDTAMIKGTRFDLPMNLGFGLCYRWNGKFALEGDVQLQSWNKVHYFGITDTLKNRMRVAVGFEYIPKIHDRSFAKNVRYRCGFSYDNLYYKVNGNKITDIGITAGVGLPLRLSKTFVNIALEYIMRRSSDNDMLKENYFKISVGVAINERWFMKRKFN